MQDCAPQKKRQGFTLLELLIVLAVIMVLGALAVPKMVSVVNDISLRYVATDLSGLLQSARIQAVRTNVPYSVMAGTLAGGPPVYTLAQGGAAYTVGATIFTLN